MKHQIGYALLSLLALFGSAKAETTLGNSYCQLTFNGSGVSNILSPSINTNGLHIKSIMMNTHGSSDISMAIGPSSSNITFFLTSSPNGEANFTGDLFIPAGNGVYVSISPTASLLAVYMTYDLIGRASSVSTAICN
jgi:hypothetical protein